jgi:hypothetical protein
MTITADSPSRRRRIEALPERVRRDLRRRRRQAPEQLRLFEDHEARPVEILKITRSMDGWSVVAVAYVDEEGNVRVEPPEESGWLTLGFPEHLGPLGRWIDAGDGAWWLRAFPKYARLRANGYWNVRPVRL